jgi:hypothetical protein
MGRTEQNGVEYIVFPSWGTSCFSWRDLPRLFVSPASYGLGDEIEQLAAMGYSVAPADHTFVHGPFGGGLIVVKREIQRWFPAVLLRRVYDLRYPPGFVPRHQDYRCRILVPRIVPEHKLGFRKIPPSPAPLFSFEPSPGTQTSDIAFAFEPKSSEGVGLPRALDLPWGCLSLRDDAPAEANEAFGRIQNPRMTYFWYRFLKRAEGIEPREIVAAIIYLGLWFADQQGIKLRALHTFSSQFIEGLSYPSAALWSSSSKTIRLASDW